MKNPPSSKPPSNKTQNFPLFGFAGFTLVELTVSLAVSAIMMAAIFGVYAINTRSYTTQNVAADVQQTVRAAIDFMAEDIMMAGFDPLEGNPAGSQFEQAGITDLHFTFDRDMDGTINAGNEENIRYYLSGTQLMQRLDEDPTTDEALIDNVTNLTFVYSNSGYSDLIAEPGFEDDTNPGFLKPEYLQNIRSVQISITVQEPAGRGGTVNRTYSTRVRCRNLGL